MAGLKAAILYAGDLTFQARYYFNPVYRPIVYIFVFHQVRDEDGHTGAFRRAHDGDVLRRDACLQQGVDLHGDSLRIGKAVCIPGSLLTHHQ